MPGTRIGFPGIILAPKRHTLRFCGIKKARWRVNRALRAPYAAFVPDLLFYEPPRFFSPNGFFIKGSASWAENGLKTSSRFEHKRFLI